MHAKKRFSTSALGDHMCRLHARPAPYRIEILSEGQICLYWFDYFYYSTYERFDRRLYKAHKGLKTECYSSIKYSRFL